MLSAMEKNKAKMFGGGIAISNRVLVREDLVEKMTAEQGHERGNRRDHVDVWQKSIPNGRHRGVNALGGGVPGVLGKGKSVHMARVE